MRDGLRLLVSGIEIVNNRLGILDLEGWSNEVTRDLDKHNENLGRIYRKYCRRSTSRNPETEIALALASSMGMHHMKRMITKTMVNRATMRNASSFKNPFHGKGREFNAAKHLDDDLSSDEDVRRHEGNVRSKAYIKFHAYQRKNHDVPISLIPDLESPVYEIKGRILC